MKAKSALFPLIAGTGIGVLSFFVQKYNRPDCYERTPITCLPGPIVLGISAAILTFVFTSE